MKKLLSLILAIFFSSCSAAPRMPMHNQDKDAQERRLDYDVASGLRRRYALHMVGFGGGLDPDHPGKCGKLSYCFDVEQQLTLDEARFLLVHAMEDVIEIVNRSDYAKNHMGTYPCTADNFWVCIAMRNPDGTDPEPPYILTMDISGNKGAVYCTSASDLEYGYTDEIHESYEEAQRIVREQEH